MRLERRHAAEHTLVVEVGTTPLHVLLDARAGVVEHVAELNQDGLGERRGVAEASMRGSVVGMARLVPQPSPARFSEIAVGNCWLIADR
jgi:hypothetical protein